MADRSRERDRPADHTPSKEIRFWLCDGAQSDCDANASTEWDMPTIITADADYWDPKVIVVPNGTALDAYVLYETANEVGTGPTNEVRVLKNCSLADTNTWDDLGNLPLPTGYTDPLERTYGYKSGSASSQWFWDGTLMHAAFLVEGDDGGTKVFDVADWSVDPTNSLVCN